MAKNNDKDPFGLELLSDEELKLISVRSITRNYPKNTVIVSEGERTDSLFIILSGQVKFYVSDEAGKEVQLGQAGPGEYFGEMMLDQGLRSASAMTLEPSRFSIVPVEDFRAFITANSAFSLNLILKLIRRVRTLTENVKNLALMDVYGRVAHLLIEMAVESEAGLVIENRPTQVEIASRVGASREMVSRILKDLTEGGYLSIEGKRILIARNLPRTW